MFVYHCQFVFVFWQCGMDAGGFSCGWTRIGFERLLALIRGGTVLGGVDFVDLVCHGGRSRERRKPAVL